MTSVKAPKDLCQEMNLILLDLLRIPPTSGGDAIRGSPVTQISSVLKPKGLYGAPEGQSALSVHAGLGRSPERGISKAMSKMDPSRNQSLLELVYSYMTRMTTAYRLPG